MKSYEVSGTCKVAGVNPGGIVTDDDLAGLNIEALVAAGSIVSPKPSKKKE